MKKIFISIPMRGYADEAIHKEQYRLKKFVEDDILGEETELIETLIDEEAPDTIKNYCWYLGRSIQLLSEADICVFHPQWREAMGCIVERQICNLYGIPFINIAIEEDEHFNSEQATLKVVD